jgi:predicted ATPase
MKDQEQEKPSKKSKLIVERFVANGIWGRSFVNIDFDPEVNFLIGPNGCGKTTIVNLLAACLSADFITLDKVDFESCSVHLRDRDYSTWASIYVEKQARPGLPYPIITYQIEGSDLASPIVFSLESVEEQIALREYRMHSAFRGANNPAVSTHLKKMANVTWLSVHRSDLMRRERFDGPSVDSLVDLKIENQLNLLVRYFSRLDQQVNDALHSFQRSMFLTLLLGKESKQDEQEGMDLSDEKAALVAILEQFSVQRSRYRKAIERHFDLLAGAARSGVSDLTQEQLIALINQRNIHQVVREWQDFVSVRDEICAVRDEYLLRANRMLSKKSVYVSKTNEPMLKTSDGGSLTFKALSSGEKQLLIVLGEALLQEGRTSIYIADEPELSLHVAWQEQLVSNIVGINPSAQIIFATHSPDIVGMYQDKIINTMDVVQ